MIHRRRVIWIVAVGLAAAALAAFVIVANAHAGAPPLDTIIGHTVMAAGVAGVGLLLAEGVRHLVVYVGGLSELPDTTSRALARLVFFAVLLAALMLCAVLLTVAWQR